MLFAFVVFHNGGGVFLFGLQLQRYNLFCYP